MNETIILLSVFVAVLLLVFTAISQVSRSRDISRNLDSASSAPQVRDAKVEDQIFATENAVVRHYFEVQKSGNPNSLEMRLIRAGFMSRNAKHYFNILRLVITVGVFVASWYLQRTFVRSVTPSVVLLLSAAISGAVFILINAVLERMEKTNQTIFRRLFPDFMDLLIVCVDAGLSIEAAIDRVAREFVQTKPSFGNHLAIVSLEVRAGRPLHEALMNFSTRVKLDEVRTLATLFRQSQELGASVNKTLRVYSKEMRQTRLIRAEEKANSLPIKMLFPLAAFLFPVNLIIVLIPVLIQIGRMFLTLRPGGA